MFLRTGGYERRAESYKFINDLEEEEEEEERNVLKVINNATPNTVRRNSKAYLGDTIFAPVYMILSKYE